RREHLNQAWQVDRFAHVNEQIEKQSQLCLQSHDPKGSGVELDFFFELCVWRMIAAKNRESAVGDALEQCSHVIFGPQGRVHLEIRIEVLHHGIGQRDVMRADFATDLDAARLCYAQNPDAARGTNMLAMNMVATA